MNQNNDLEKLYNSSNNNDLDGNNNSNPYMQQSNLDLESDKSYTQQMNVVAEPIEVKQPVRREEEVKTIPCRKCSRPMKITDRCCLYCGELNYYNNQNQGVNKVFKKGEKVRDSKDLTKMNDKNIDNNTSTEKKPIAILYRFYSNLKRIIIVLLIILIIANYKNIYNLFNSLRAKYYLYQVNSIIEKIEVDYPDTDCYDKGGNLYYEFNTLKDHNIKTFVSLYTLKPLNGYVKVVPKDNYQYDYYIYISDGKYGITDVLYSDSLDTNIIKELEFSDIYTPKDGIICNKSY